MIEDGIDTIVGMLIFLIATMAIIFIFHSGIGLTTQIRDETDGGAITQVNSNGEAYNTAKQESKNYKTYNYNKKIADIENGDGEVPQTVTINGKVYRKYYLEDMNGNIIRESYMESR